MNAKQRAKVAVFSAAVAVSRLVLAGEPAWTTTRTDADGLVVESRPAEGTDLPELKVSHRASASPRALLEAAWELRSEGMQATYLERRAVLSSSASERLLFLSVRPPIIGVRQCVLRQWRWGDPASGAQHLHFAALPFTPANPDVTPFSKLSGQWSFEPDGGGGTRIVYVTLIDVGRVPAWLARGPQQNAAVDTVREVIARAAAF